MKRQLLDNERLCSTKAISRNREAAIHQDLLNKVKFLNVCLKFLKKKKTPRT